MKNKDKLGCVIILLCVMFLCLKEILCNSNFCLYLLRCWKRKFLGAISCLEEYSRCEFYVSASSVSSSLREMSGAVSSKVAVVSGANR